MLSRGVLPLFFERMEKSYLEVWNICLKLEKDFKSCYILEMYCLQITKF